MNIVIEQSQMAKQTVEITYQEPFPLTVRCKRGDCKGGEAMLIMLIDDIEKALVDQRPENVRVWPHDSSVIAIYLCTECGSMRARWNQG